jgi:hypothetical protein
LNLETFSLFYNFFKEKSFSPFARKYKDNIVNYITMKVIISFINKFFSKKIVRPVGRWRIENCNVQLNKKIDLSNEDHCGPCGQYALEKIPKKDIIIYSEKERK